MTPTTGLDMAFAATPAQAKQMLNAVGGSWLLVYIGGLRNGGHGWGGDYVKKVAAQGVKSFLPCYVGPQVVPSLGLNDIGLLTATQGYKDGQDAIAQLIAYEWEPPCPCALDIEYDTAQRATEATVAYSDGWCKAVRDAGYVPGVYGPLFFLTRLWQETNRPTFIYASDWIRSTVDHGLDPAHIPGLADDVAKGARVWQYAGDAAVLGIGADIDVANIPLAPVPGIPAPMPADYAAAAWVAHVDGLVSNVPVKACLGHKAAVLAWIKDNP